MCIIAVANQKGGTGKTTTCVNLGIGLARAGKKVLLVDADAQGSMAVSLGVREPDNLDHTIVNIMEKVINDEDIADNEGIMHHEEGVDFIPANIELAGLETALVGVMSREFVLKSYLDNIKDKYDYILIDCMPSLGMVTINALVAADYVLIPVEAAYNVDNQSFRELKEGEKGILTYQGTRYLGVKIILYSCISSCIL